MEPSAEDSIPLSNRQSTILGVTISFQVVAILSVLLRLYIRFRLMKSPGWDDLLVTLSVMSVAIGTILVCLSTNYGLGQHFAALSPSQIEQYLFHFYIANGSYNMSTILIKLSLLFQYLRISDARATKVVCIGLIVLISMWGIAFSVMAWLPCFPVRAYWDWTITDATCYAFGTKVRGPFVTTYEAHAAVNLIWDLVVFIIPISFVWRKQRSTRENVAVLVLFTLGALVVAISCWRLATIVAHQAGWEPQLDFTFYAPISILLACLEVDIAVLAASMPVFWPVILNVLGPIFVTQEVHVTRGPRWRSSDVELECSSTHSEAELHRKSSVAKAVHYQDTYTVERMDSVNDSKHSVNRTIEVHGKWDET